jgi:1-acyl-sn-glycerol-3-phosphate acyltransferase
MFAVIHTFFAFLILGILTIAVVPAGLILFVFGLFFPKAARLFTYKIAQGWSRLIIKLVGGRITVTWREHIPRTGPVCIASNH